MNSIRQRLLWLLLAPLAALIAAGGSVMYSIVRRVVVAEFDYALLAKAEALTSLPEAGRVGISLQFTERSFQEFERNENPEYYQVWLADGTVLARSPSLGEQSLPKPDLFRKSPVFSSLTLPDGNPGRLVALAVELDGGRPPKASSASDDFGVHVAFARDSVHLRRVLGLLLGGMVLGGLALLLLVNWLIRRAVTAGLKPMESVAAQVTHIHERSLDFRFPLENVPAELVPMIHQLNELMSRLQRAFDRERRFSANVAHELATPLAELRALAEIAVKWPESPEATSGLGKDALEIAGQMERSVITLLTLARSEAGMEKFRRRPVDLVELLEEIRAGVAARLAERRLMLEWKVPAEASVQTDRAACRSILQNLLDNAVEHTPFGERIECSLEAEKDGFLLRLTNTNPGLVPDDLPNLFEPLWRKDQARSDRGHSGLGLALTQSLARALGMSIDAALPDGGAWFEINLHIPATPAPAAGTGS